MNRPATEIVWPVLGEFERVSTLQGGIGQVFVARHVADRTLVVIKTLVDYSDIKAVRAFEHEAYVWMAIPAHPNILPAIRVDRDSTDRPFVITLYVDQGDLRALIGKPPLTNNLARTLSFAIQICDGLIHAYKHSIQVHGDIKPENCLRLTHDRILLTDFGMARAGFCAVGAPAGGTPEYLAPEQALDMNAARSPADVYSLGAMIVEMATGRPPFGRRSETLDGARLAQLHASATPQVNIEFQPLAGLARRCLRKAPEERPAIESLRAELAQLYRQLAGKSFPETRSHASINSVFTHLIQGMSFKEIPEAVPRAESSFRKALALDPTNEDALGQLADCLRTQKRLDEALRYVAQATTSAPYNPALWDIQGSILHEMDRREEALQCFQKAIALDPTIALYHYNLAVMLDETDPAAAMASYRRATQLDPDHAESWCNLAVLHEKNMELEQAEAHYRKALSIKRHLRQALFGLVDVLEATNRPDEADQTLSHAIDVSPHDGILKARQIKLLVQRGEIERAQRLFDLAEAKGIR